MPEPRNLGKAPITEAVIDIRAEFTSPLELTLLERLIALLLDRYPDRKTIHEFQVQVEVREGAPTTQKISNASASGYLLSGGERKEVVQCKVNGITYSKLAPYSSWEETTEETLRVWRFYRELFAPTYVSRVSTRFLNRIIIPAGHDIDDYVTMGPRPPKGLPDAVMNFTTSMVVPVGEQTRARMACTYDGTGTDAGIPMVVDVDIIRDCRLLGAEEAALTGALSDLRPIKNAAFFGILTDKALETYL